MALVWVDARLARVAGFAFLRPMILLALLPLLLALVWVLPLAVLTAGGAAWRGVYVYWLLGPYTYHQLYTHHQLGRVVVDPNHGVRPVLECAVRYPRPVEHGTAMLPQER